MIHEADVGIVGAGPAGTRAAELLASAGARVVVLDHRAPWEKPCGGGLTSGAFVAMPALEEVRSWAHPVREIRVEGQGAEPFDLPLRHPIWIVSRRRLARWQIARAHAAGARLVQARVTGAQRLTRRAGWLLTTSDGSLTVGTLVGTDGAASRVRRTVAPDARIELLPARVLYLPAREPAPPRVTLRFFEGVAGYLWEFPRTDHRSVGIAVEPGNWPRRRMDAELDAYRSAAGSDGVQTPVGAVIGTAQLGHGDYRWIGGEDYALLGDAAGLADPLTGEGIRNALRSANLLAQAWHEGNARRYPALCREAFEEEFRTARLLRRCLFGEGVGTRWLRNGSRSAHIRALASILLNGLNGPGPIPMDALASLTKRSPSRQAARWDTHHG